MLAVALLVVVLAGVVPPDSFASSHECGMACCAGKSPHSAGSCNTALGGDEGDSHAAHDHAAHGASRHSSARRAAGKESRRTAGAAAAALTKPCSPECAAAAYSSSQVRRPRHAASVVVGAQPGPPAARSFARRPAALTPKSADHTRQARPRAPPATLIDLSA
jgi:hypothetical protein